jgi:alpha-N-arabinofuranosidase
LYRNEYGQIPVAVSNVPRPLDAAAALDEAQAVLTVSIVNPTEKPVSWSPSLTGKNLAGEGTCWTIGGTDKLAHNVPGQEPQVRIVEEKIKADADEYVVPPMSLSLYKFALK